MIGQHVHEPACIPAPAGLRLRIYRDIREIDPRDWNCLLGPDDLLMSHSFVLTCQEAQIEDAEFWHLIVSQGEEIAGIATLHRMSVDLELLSEGLTREMIGKLKQRWSGFLRIPVLFCGLPVSCGTSCLRISGRADFRKVCTLVTDTMERVAAATSTPLLCLKEFDDSAISQMDCVLARGYFRANSLPSCALPLRWDSFTSYVGCMKANYRRQVQSTLRARDRGEFRIVRLQDISPHVETIFALYQQTIRRARHRLETLNPQFFTLLGRYLAGRTKALLIEHDGRPLAMAVMLFSPNVATFLFAGMDDDQPRDRQIYENLVLEVVAEAIPSGARRLELGQTSYPMKSRTGAEESPRSLYLRHRSPLQHGALNRLSGYLFPRHEYPRRRVFVDRQGSIL